MEKKTKVNTIDLIFYKTTGHFWSVLDESGIRYRPIYWEMKRQTDWLFDQTAQQLDREFSKGQSE